MLSIPTLSVFTTLLISFAAAQNSTKFDPSQVDLSTKNSWCTSEMNTCPILCGGQLEKTQCFGQTLDYTCTCSNGSAPANIGDYQGSLPNFICQATFAQCRKQNPGSQACKNCGTLDPKSVPQMTSSAAAPSSAAPTSTGGAEAASAASTTPTHGAAPRNAKAVEGAGLVGGVLAALLL